MTIRGRLPTVDVVVVVVVRVTAVEEAATYGDTGEELDGVGPRCLIPSDGDVGDPRVTTANDSSGRTRVARRRVSFFLAPALMLTLDDGGAEVPRPLLRLYPTDDVVAVGIHGPAAVVGLLLEAAVGLLVDVVVVAVVGSVVVAPRRAIVVGAATDRSELLLVGGGCMEFAPSCAGLLVVVFEPALLLRGSAPV